MQTPKLFYVATVLLLAMTIFYSCQKDEIQVQGTENSNSVETREGKIPCTVENMQQAYENLKKNPTASPYPADNSKNLIEYQVTTTHYYYRFFPQTSEEYELLIDDEVLEIADTPFENEVVSEGPYVDVGEGSEFIPTSYYSVVPVGHSLPSSVQSELLADLHFTPEETIGQNPTSHQRELLKFYYDLNLEALKIADKIPMDEKQALRYKESINPSPTISMSYSEVMANNIPFSAVIIDFSEIEEAEKMVRWTPSGSVTVEEDILTDIGSPNNIVGVRNATVKVRKWGFLVIAKDETDINGDFSTKRIRTRRVKYAVYFHPKHDRFKVMGGNVFWRARHRGTNTYSRAPWNQHFDLGGRSHFYSLVHNAAADYMYEWAGTGSSSFGLSRPRNEIKISAKYNGTGSSNFIPTVEYILIGGGLQIISDIRVRRLDGNGNYRGSDGIYAVTTHELTHAGHYKLDPGLFVETAGLANIKEREIIIESWAEGVETIVTNFRYGTLDENYFNNDNDFLGRNFWRQTREVEQMNEYTPLFIDLNDDLNQNIIYGTASRNPPIDNVSGYTVEQMQLSLIGVRSLWELRMHVFWLWNNPTQDSLEELFEYPNEVLENL